MRDLVFGYPTLAEATKDQIVASGDERFVAVFLELMRAIQIGVVQELSYPEVVEALTELTGEPYGGNWPAWVEWYGRTDLEPPEGFAAWKAALFARIDPGFADFLSGEPLSTLRIEAVLWGGVRIGSIPALDNPSLIAAEEADYLRPDEPVFGLTVNGDARAYPLAILDWHELVNDVVGGTPVSLAYCTLCGAGIVYDGRASNGEIYTFGTSGLLYRSNKVMYDRETRSLWNQLTGKPIIGPLVRQDVRLNLLPVVLTSWEAWQTQHPETLVLSPDTGYERPYRLGAAYGDYFASPFTMFPVSQRSDLLDQKEQIYALRVDSVPVAYPIETLVEEEVVNDTVEDAGLVVIARGGSLTGYGESIRTGPVTYEAGAEVRAYYRQTERFEPGPEPDQLLDEQGGIWQVTEETLLGPSGERRERISGHIAYWFGWYAFYPQTLVYGIE